MKKTIKKRAFVSAIAMLIVSAIVLTSSTFAWFSMAKRVEVETMQLNITSPEGIQISANTNAFTTTLTKGDFDGTSTTRFKADNGNTNHFPEDLSPSSCAFRVGAGKLPAFYSGSINNDKKANIRLVDDDKNGKYVVFDLFVKLGANTSVFFGESTVSCGDNKDVPSAMRIAFVNCGSGDKVSAKTVTSNIRENGLNRSVIVYEPAAFHHTADSGAEEGKALNTAAVLGEIDNESPTGTNKNIVSNSNTNFLLCTQVNETQTSNAYFDAVAGINRIRVYIWMEGQDVDCANDVAGSQIDVNLVLTIN